MDKQISKEQLKQILLDILINIDDFCKQNDIQYSLAFGTLLGAVRHHGFIPWDDDVDIMMTRENYEKFRSLYDSPTYPLADLKTSTSHPVSMGKIYDSRTYFYYQGKIKRNYGVFVDVFPLDKVPDEIETRNSWLRQVRRYVKYNQFKNNTFAYTLGSSNLITKVIGCIVKIFFSSKYIHYKLEYLFSKYKNEESSYLGVPAVMVMKKEFVTKIFPVHIFNEYTRLQFEGRYFPCITEYDNFLQIFYGDYMQLPPIEKRIGKHGILAFFK